MTVPFGDGHYATATKIASLLKDSGASLDIEVIDVITEGWPSYSRLTTKMYLKSTASSGGFWYGFFYRLMDIFPWPQLWFASLAFRRYAKRLLLRSQPDLIIATFPFLGHVAWRARQKLGLTTPIATVVTDAGRVQGVWLVGHEDEILTATPDTIDYAKKRHLSASRLLHIGFPIDKAFHEAPDKRSARQQLGLDTSKFTVLITSGGLGMSAAKASQLVKLLAATTLPIQLICVAGKNAALKTTYEQIAKSSDANMTIYSYTDKMPLLMAASDIVCSKAGWLTISEAMAVKRPVYIFDVIPGQEEENARYVTRNKYGLLAPQPEVMARLILDAAEHPELLTASLEELHKISTEECPRRLTQHFLELLGENTV